MTPPHPADPTAPRRIQRRRTHGYRLPPDAIYVGRPSRWGNPYRLGTNYLTSPHLASFHVPSWRDPGDYEYDIHVDLLADAATAVEWFREWPTLARLDLAPLRGHDLACWCPTCSEHADGLPLGVKCPDCAPCHADVLLELANR